MIVVRPEVREVVLRHLQGLHDQDSHGGEGVAKTVISALDKLKLGTKAPHGFTVRSSRKLTSDDADVGVAEVDGPDGPQIRVGLITAESGRWDAGFVGEGRKAQLRQQIAEKQALFDSDAEVPDDLEDEIGALEGELRDLDDERTAILSPDAVAGFRRQLGVEGLALAKANKAKQDATLKALDALDEQRDDVIDEFGDAALERDIRREQNNVWSKKYRLRLLRQDPGDERIPEAETDVAEAEGKLAPLLARRAELMPPDALARLEDVERQQLVLTEDDIDDIITSVEAPAPNGSRVVAQVWGSDDVDSDWVATRLYVLKPGETTNDADNEDGYAYMRGLKGLNKLIAGFEPAERPGGRSVRPHVRALVVELPGVLKFDGMTPGWAKEIASKWFHDVFGFWPGDRKGKNPVGPRGTVRPHVRALVAEMLRMALNQPRDEDGKWSKLGAVKNALAAVAGVDGDEIHSGYGVATFPDREGVATGRAVEWEYDGDDDAFNLSVYSDEIEADEDGEQRPPTLQLRTQQLTDLATQMAADMLRSQAPPLDPNDRQSVLLHSILQTNGRGAAVSVGDEAYIDISAGLEVSDEDGDSTRFDLSPDEFAQLHAAIALTLAHGAPTPPE